MNKVEVLAQYLPAGAAPLIARWIDYFQCEFKIAKSRNSKLGDYRHPFRGRGHRISVNHNLNNFAFLVTTVHEFAHLLTWNDHKHVAKPHGAEWKKNFGRLMQPFFEMGVFPADLHQAIDRYLTNPAASSCTDLNLARALKVYDRKPDGQVSLEQLPVHAVFALKNGRKFKKGVQIRKRYRCVCMETGHTYLVSPLAEVLPIS